VNTIATIGGNRVGVTAQGGTVVPVDGTFSVNGTHDQFTYTPKHNFVGADSFQYHLEDLDGLARSRDLTVSFFVEPGLRVLDDGGFEGGPGPVAGHVCFTIELFPPYPAGGPTVTVEWATRDGTARGGIYPGLYAADDYFIAGSTPFFPVTFSSPLKKL